VSLPLQAVPPACFEGLIPAPFATCSPEGTPNITYMSIVHLIDAERVGLSRQFFNKTRANLERNPLGQLRVVDPATMRQYALDLQYLHTETEGRTFEGMKANLEAIASQQGMADVFRLRGVDVHRVVRCAIVDGDLVPAARPAPVRDVLAPLDEFVRRLGQCESYADATRTALEALDDLFGFRHSILLVADEDQRLLGVAGNGYAASAAGAEVPAGVGLIGIAAERRQVVSVASLARTRALTEAIRERAALPGREIPLPGLPSAQSAAAVPLPAPGGVLGVLYLESEEPGRFGPQTERLLRILGGHLASILGMLDDDRLQSAETPSAPPPDPAAGEVLAVEYYQADDSVFVAGEYLVRGVPGRILWRLLNEHSAGGRTAFTNRELRLDERLGLPAGNDNLEARLLVLRKRLAAARCGIGLERVGRGRLALHVARALALSEVPTSGPMRAAHD
jgi:GAF domain-containing protein/pyridoxamine 5'-phosphate oxidase-like protein